ncbi:MAG: extracellular solute-binding protein [Rhodospirillaceae bacterium]|nr:extracellular solute-binding protein [Rhodospirillaceae bacterium]
MDQILRRKGLSRREFHATLAKLGLGVATVTTLARPSLAAENDVTVFEWGGYDVPELFPQYVEKYGAGPEFTLFASEEEALQKMLAGFEVDLAHPCSYNIKRWRDAGVAGPIDTSRLIHWNDIWGQFKNIPDQNADGQTFFVPLDCGNSSIAYRTDLVDPEDAKSWDLLFNEKYAGRLAMYNTDTTLIEIAARVNGMYDDYLHLSEEQLVEIKALLVKQRDLLRFYWDDAGQVAQGLASGEIVAAYAWNETIKTLTAEGVPVAYMVPKEGILTWVCGFTMSPDPKGDLDAVYDFINAWTSPEAGQFIISEYGYGHSNSKAYELVDPEVLASLGMSDPKALFDEAAIAVDADEPYRSRYIELVEEVKAGI